MADVRVDVKVDDKGSLKKVGKSAQSARRQIGGVARTASAGGKQFSKMSQGITGGLVPAYAQLAATLFAVDAVFRALKESADLRVQRAGMVAYAAATGTALQTVANSLKLATDSQLSFKEAASASAIGMAAGLTADQINEIGIAAKNASIALGRNFTDSFDRVLKGIVKGEPELLDELGIILRLEKATLDYARSLNISKDSLTAYQRSQAVHLEVIKQATDKYAAMSEGIEVSKIVQLMTALEEIKNTVAESIAPVAEFIADVFTKNVSAAIALLLVFATSIISKILPAMGALNKSMMATGGVAAAKMGASIGRMKGSFGNMREQFKQTMQPGARAQSAARAMGPSKSALVTALQDGKKLNAAQLGQTKAMLKKAEKEWEKHGKITTGKMAGENIKKVKNLRVAVEQMKHPIRGWANVAKHAAFGVGNAFKVAMTGIVLTVRGAMTVAKLAVQGFAWTANAAMKAVGFIGLAMMIFQIFQQLMDNIDKIMKFVGNALKLVGEKFKAFADRAREAGWTRVADGLDKMASAATDAGDKLVKMGKAKTDALAKVRAQETVIEQINEIAEAARKATDEIKTMKLNLAEAAEVEIKEGRWKKGQKFTDIFEQRKFEAKAVGTTGGSAVAGLGALGKMKSEDIAGEAGKKSAIAIAGQLDELAFINSGYGALAANLRTMAIQGTLTATEVENFTKKLKKHNETVATSGNSIMEIDRITESYTKTLYELNKGIGKTRIDKILKETKKYRNEYSALVGKEGGDTALNEKQKEIMIGIFGPERAAEINTLGQALAALKDETQGYLGLQRELRQLESDKLDNQMASVKASRYGGALGKYLQRGVKLDAMSLSIQGKSLDLQDQERILGTLVRENDEEGYLQQLEAVNLSEKALKLEQEKRKVYKETTSIMGQAQAIMSSGFEKLFQDIAEGTKSLAEIFKSFFANIAKQMAAMLAQEAAARAMFMMFGLAEGGIIPKAYASGGIIKRKVPSYSSGGIATQPTYLVGEGKYNEAVVPLPNGRSIPVEMKGGGGNVSNITVNVAAGGQQQTTTARAGERERKLGQLIAAAVQAEILDQQRPGGILSPYGDGGI